MGDITETRTPSLYALAGDLQKALDNFSVDVETGEAFGLEEIEACKAAFEEKAEATAVAIKSAQAFADAISAERDRLAERQKAAEAKAERLKSYLTDMMNKVGMEKFESTKAQIKFGNSEAVIITDEDAIPAQYGDYTWKPDKAEIKKALKAGTDIPGARIEKRRNIQIK